MGHFICVAVAGVSTSKPTNYRHAHQFCLNITINEIMEIAFAASHAYVSIYLEVDNVAGSCVLSSRS